MSDITIKAEGLSKRYRIGLEEKKHDTMTGALVSWLKSPVQNYRDLKKLSTFKESEEGDDIIWALKDVSFEVKRGEAIGIIGRNGAGKSTLLKLLARITEPTSGYADVYGRVASLLEVGTGFHPELTGRENVYLNATILGMSKAEVDRKFDEIVAFSEIEKFIDTPVKRYSSGMRVRLAFAVAAHLEPEILLVDEVLAVGDLAFQKKCLGKMENVTGEGRTVLFVSHQMALVQSLCARGILFENGRMHYDGPMDTVINTYISRSQEISEKFALGEREDRKGGKVFRFQRVEFLDPDTMQPLGTLLSGQPVLIRIGYRLFTKNELQNADVSISFFNTVGAFLFECRNDMAGKHVRLAPGEGETYCFIRRWPLSEGRFSFALAARHGAGNMIDLITEAGFVDVQPGDYYGNGARPYPNAHCVLIDFEWFLDTDQVESVLLNV